jgi:hypothetical protein
LLQGKAARLGGGIAPLPGNPGQHGGNTMKKLLRFNQGPYSGQDVEVEEDEAVIQNYLATGYCEEAEPKPVPAPEPEAPPKRERRVLEKAVVAEVAPETAPEVKKKAAKKKTVRRKKRETPEG